MRIDVNYLRHWGIYSLFVCACACARPEGLGLNKNIRDAVNML